MLRFPVKLADGDVAVGENFWVKCNGVVFQPEAPLVTCVSINGSPQQLYLIAGTEGYPLQDCYATEHAAWEAQMLNLDRQEHEARNRLARVQAVRSQLLKGKPGCPGGSPQAA